MISVFRVLYAIARRLPWKLRESVAYMLSAIAKTLNVSGRLPIWIGDNKLMLDVGDLWQSHMLVRFYEMDIEHVMRRILQPGGTYVDVGAQLGYTSALAAELVGKDGKMLLFEPDPRLLPRIQSSLAASINHHGMVTIVPAACTDKAGDVTLQMLSTLGWSQIATDPAGSQDCQRVQVPAVTLDQQLETLGSGYVDLLKVDVEGHEISVLRGALSSLANKRIRVLCIEKNPGLLEQAGYSSRHLHAMLATHGYVGCRQDGEPIHEADLDNYFLENLFYFADNSDYRKAFDREYAGVQSLRPEVLEKCWMEAREYVPAFHRRQAILQIARSGSVDQAIETAEKVLLDEPTEDELRGHLAHWYVYTNRLSQAMAHYQVLVQRQPNNVDLRERIAKVESTRVKH